jgi:hypothetical protein
LAALGRINPLEANLLPPNGQTVAIDGPPSPADFVRKRRIFRVFVQLIMPKKRTYHCKYEGRNQAGELVAIETAFMSSSRSHLFSLN